VTTIAASSNSAPAPRVVTAPPRVCGTDIYPQALWLREPLEAYVLQIRDSNTKLLKPQSEWVGTYTLPNKTQIPAVFVTGSQIIPSDWVIEGIELAITEVPEISPIASTLNGVIAIEKWSVRFTNYGTKSSTVFPTTLLEISRRLGRLHSAAVQTYMARTHLTYESLSAKITVHNLQTSLP